jgi:hypothetical protein
MTYSNQLKHELGPKTYEKMQQLQIVINCAIVTLSKNTLNTTPQDNASARIAGQCLLIPYQDTQPMKSNGKLGQCPGTLKLILQSIGHRKSPPELQILASDTEMLFQDKDGQVPDQTLGQDLYQFL